MSGIISSATLKLAASSVGDLQALACLWGRLCPQELRHLHVQVQPVPHDQSQVAKPKTTLKHHSIRTLLISSSTDEAILLLGHHLAQAKV